MKIYTKQGDGGKTSLLGGEKVWKDNQRIKAYGTVDELNAILGIVITESKSEELIREL
ncbi:MAG: ATP:cob(I)alamin adenosyltransferase, partial [Melioribacter sp.]|nr:ATP:cob(I)alamin adenosyltransferase [Melioribacter sp.]